MAVNEHGKCVLKLKLCFITNIDSNLTFNKISSYSKVFTLFRNSHEAKHISKFSLLAYIILIFKLLSKPRVLKMIDF